MPASSATTRLTGLLAAVVACGSESVSTDPPDATPPPDAAAICPALDLAPEELRGDSPFGDLDLRVATFGVGDCIEVSRADLTLEGPAGDSLNVNFTYPVEVDNSGLRFVAMSFDAAAGFRYTPATGPDEEGTYMVHVDVASWQERAPIPHDIDITVTITDAAFAVEPLLVSGTFCKWVSLLCAD
jgi:hypothetical protein